MLLLILFSSNTFSQGKRKSFYGKKGGAAPTWFIGGGVLAGDMTGLSFYGPAVEISRKMPVIKMGNYMNFSLDPNITAGYGWYSSYTQSGTTQSALVSCAFNFNALAGAYNPVKKSTFGIPVGLFLGPGVMVRAAPSITVNEKTLDPIDFGPYVNFGLRFKVSKGYFFDLKIYGGFTVFNEVAAGGFLFRFPFGMGNSGKRKPNVYVN